MKRDKGTEFPSWWPQAVAIEYLECREYGGQEEIWKFDFDRLREDDLLQALEEVRVVIHGTVFHNVHEVTWRTRVVFSVGGASTLQPLAPVAVRSATLLTTRLGVCTAL